MLLHGKITEQVDNLDLKLNYKWYKHFQISLPIDWDNVFSSNDFNGNKEIVL
jgi:hypothetical protein